MCYTIDSQSSTILEPTFQMDQLHDPADFLQPMRNTRKELRKQRGEDPNEPQIPTTARQRRPEMPRRTSYQHHVYSSQPENDVLSSQEALQDTVHIVKHAMEIIHLLTGTVFHIYSCFCYNTFVVCHAKQEFLLTGQMGL
ncbi:hypothetical protein Hanom_Chr10g00887691 [Helianthus anomalus]